MPSSSSQETWEQYSTRELSTLRPILHRLGFELDAVQVHLGGERSVISGRKLVLLGTRASDGKRVVIKASSYAEGKHEMELEYRCREVLDEMKFSYNSFLSPTLLLWRIEEDCLISITEFLEQDSPFLERPLHDQFFLAMKAFETQEGSHATTYEHTRMIRKAFRVFETSTYLQRFHNYRDVIEKTGAPELGKTLEAAEQLLVQRQERIEQYNGFLTHGDFVPHNVRIVGRDIYLLDHFDIRFGNKYDGWARFLNFMLLYHRELETLLLQYVKENRSHEEQEALHLMRIYRLGELIWYYVQRLGKSTGKLLELDRARISFWGEALQAELAQSPLPQPRILAYQQLRDSLRSDEEKQRQKGLH